MRILITGATGYIGQRLVCQAVLHGHQVSAATRYQPVQKIEWIPFDLSAEAEIIIPKRTDAVVHLATLTPFNSDASILEQEAAKRLIRAANQVAAKIIFVSSQTAREDAPTAYGRTKWQIERLILAAGGWVIRPGQVYGGHEHALFGEIVNVVRKSPAIPAFLPAPMIQPVHVDDLVAVLLQCAESNNIPSSILCIGSPIPVSFTVFLQTIAKVRLKKFRLSIPFPAQFFSFIDKISGQRLHGRLKLERLKSLFDLPTMQTNQDLQLLGIALRSLPSGMTRSGNDQRRNLIREGNILLQYVLKAKPTQTLVRRYVRCIEQMRGGHSLPIPSFLFLAPVTIALLDHTPSQPTRLEQEFIWRLNAAVVLAEATVQGARRFLGIGENTSFTSSLGHMSKAVVLELFWKVLRIITKPALRRAIHKDGYPNES